MVYYVRLFFGKLTINNCQASSLPCQPDGCYSKRLYPENIDIYVLFHVRRVPALYTIV